jgi:hypothetical protein
MIHDWLAVSVGIFHLIIAWSKVAVQVFVWLTNETVEGILSVTIELVSIDCPVLVTVI